MKTSVCLFYGIFLLTGLMGTLSARAHGIADERLHALAHEIEAEPGNPALYIRQGRIYRDSAQWNEALRSYAQALLADPQYHEALYWQGDAYWLKGDYPAARRALENYLSRRPDSAAGHTALARVYVSLENYLTAAEHYQQAIGHDPHPSPQLYMEWARALMKIQPLPYQRIQDGLLAAIEKQGAIVTLVELLLELNVAVKNYPQAIEALTRLPANLQNTPRWLNRRARLEGLQGHREQALALYHQALSRLAALPTRRQGLPAYVTARQEAENGLRQLEAGSPKKTLPERGSAIP